MRRQTAQKRHLLVGFFYGLVMNELQRYKILTLTVSMLLLPFVPSAEEASAWRSPTQSELAGSISWRKEDPNLHVVARADFDGDGKEDVARLLINDKENKLGLFVTLSSEKRAAPLLLEAVDNRQAIEVMGIKVAKPGTYKTACGKGYWICETGEPPVLKLKNPAIDLFSFEKANSYIVWEKKTRRFKTVHMSD